MRIVIKAYSGAWWSHGGTETSCSVRFRLFFLKGFCIQFDVNKRHGGKQQAGTSWPQWLVLSSVGINPLLLTWGCGKDLVSPQDNTETRLSCKHFKQNETKTKPKSMPAVYRARKRCRALRFFLKENFFMNLASAASVNKELHHVAERKPSTSSTHSCSQAC